MEIILVLAALLIIGAIYWTFFRNESVKMEETAPYKLEPFPPITEPKIEEKEVKAEVRVDPVAVALDLEPAVISAPAKRTRKTRGAKASAPGKAQSKAAVKSKSGRRPRSKKT